MPKPLKPSAHIGYPFKNQESKRFTDPQPAYEGLAGAEGGHYPLGSNGFFHGGIHFTSGTANRFEQSSGVMCLADGEIVAYRINRHYPDASLTSAVPAKRPLSTGFVLMRHSLQPPSVPSSEAPATEKRVLEYGVRLAEYPFGPSVGWLPLGTRVKLLELRRDWVLIGQVTGEKVHWLAQPVADAWIPISALGEVPQGIRLARLAGHPLSRELVSACTPHPDQLQAVLDAKAAQADYQRQCAAAAARPTLTYYSLYMHLADAASYANEPTRSVPAWWPSTHQVGAKATDTWVAKNPPLLGLNIREKPTSRSTLLGLAPRDSVIEVGEHSPNRKWRRIRQVLKGTLEVSPAGASVETPAEKGWVFLEELEDEVRALKDQDYDLIIQPSSPIRLKAGALIGHLGEGVSSQAGLIGEQPASSPLMHLEVFSADDVPRFIYLCRNWVEDTPKEQWNLLALRKGESINSQPKAEAEALLCLPDNLTLPLAGLQTNIDNAGQRWYQVNIQGLKGWVPEIDHLCSPWHWRGFEVVDASSSASGCWWEGGAQAYLSYILRGLRPKETPFFSKVRELVDTDGDGHLSEKELDTALNNRVVAARLGGMIAYHVNAWHVPSWADRFGMLDEIAAGLGKVAQHALEAEKPSVQMLQWWSVVAKSLGLPQDAKVYHFHPIGLAGCFEAFSPIVTAGKLTFDGEGNDEPSSIYFSRVIHWPGNDLSGVTLGRGYDMGFRSEDEIYSHMISSEIPPAQAKKIAKAHGLRGASAKDFVSNYKLDIGTITQDQQINLFNTIYPTYVERTIKNYDYWTSETPEKTPWEELSPIIQDVLVDFVYQGFTKGGKPMTAGMKNNFDILIQYIENTPDISKHEPSRRRAEYLRRNK
ncbi:pesticin C-terminus-like muramidase [Pseudomonas sp. JDS08PS003]|uniref:pesticin C-terminus-like muramidase n=1 Tax=Pseudomonas sp. JDS08PS003 TaxID=2497162 RepID=UPI0038579C9C